LTATKPTDGKTRRRRKEAGREKQKDSQRNSKHIEKTENGETKKRRKKKYRKDSKRNSKHRETRQNR
jgi:hypothetical protein